MTHEGYWHRIALKVRAYSIGFKSDDTKWRETQVAWQGIGNKSM